MYLQPSLKEVAKQVGFWECLHSKRTFKFKLKFELIDCQFGKSESIHARFGYGKRCIKSTENLSSRKYNTKNAKLQAELDVYKTIFEALFPNAPNIKDIDVPTFLQIFQNFKSSAPTFLDDVMKEYNLIASENTISPAGTEGSPDDINRSETNSVCSVRDCETPVMDAKENSKTSHSSSIPPVVGREIKIILPPKPIALEFVKNTWEHCCVLLRFYHRPTFIKQMDELYETDPHNYSHEQMRFLPLCYSTMAVGALFRSLLFMMT